MEVIVFLPFVVIFYCVYIVMQIIMWIIAMAMLGLLLMVVVYAVSRHRKGKAKKPWYKE